MKRTLTKRLFPLFVAGAIFAGGCSSADKQLIGNCLASSLGLLVQNKKQPKKNETNPLEGQFAVYNSETGEYELTKRPY